MDDDERVIFAYVLVCLKNSYSITVSAAGANEFITICSRAYMRKRLRAGT